MAKLCNWDPVCQLKARFQNYGLEHGQGFKYDLAIKGDSFTNHKKSYLLQYFKAVYDFFNTEVSSTFEEARTRQANAPDRCVTIKIETRPDLIDDDWCRFLLELGVTTVELGVQSLDDRVLKLNRRGHNTEAVVNASNMLKSFGFEVVYQVMVGMVGSSPEIDEEMLTERLWLDELAPDALKIYPCLLLKNLGNQRELAKYVDSPDWTPLTDARYVQLLNDCLPQIPSYVHINRIQRLISPEDVLLGPRTMLDRKVFNNISQCLWQRSVAQCDVELDADFSKYEIEVHPQGQGYCIKTVWDNKVLLGYSRLSFFTGQAMIRDHRVLGNMLPVSYQNSKRLGAQHIGIGKAMIVKMEAIAREAGYTSIKLHAAAGVLNYYTSLGYNENNSQYLVKLLSGN